MEYDSKSHVIYLTVPRMYRKVMRRRFMRAMLWRLPHMFEKEISIADMVTMFRKRYKTGNLFESVLDGATDWYLSALYHCDANFSLMPNDTNTVAVDLGCGAASVGFWLRNNDYKWSYIGVDAAKEASIFFEHLENSQFLSKKIEDINGDDFFKKPDVIFAVNSFCYTQKIESVLRNLHSFSKPNTKLVIIDGHPSYLWNKKYPSSNYDMQTWTHLLESNGWSVDKKFMLSIYNFANIPIMKISQGYFCSRKLSAPLHR